ncbi:alpha/beta hydrolase-fold protein [Streptomyces sp. M19]
MTALYAALVRPDRFGAVLAQSSSLWWRPGLPQGVPKSPVSGEPWLVRATRRRGRGPSRCTWTWGSTRGHGRLQPRAVRAAARPGAPGVLNEFNGGHDYACWHGALADGLVRLLGPGPP